MCVCGECMCVACVCRQRRLEVNVGHFFMLYVCMWTYVTCVDMHMPWHSCRGQRASYRTQISFSTVRLNLPLGVLTNSGISLSLSPEHSEVSLPPYSRSNLARCKSHCLLSACWKDPLSLPSQAGIIGKPVLFTPHLPGFRGLQPHTARA